MTDWYVHCGDSRDVLTFYPDECFDSMCCDPPSGTGFMGKSWDKNKGGRDQWIDWLAGILREAFRVLKPGAHALVWALPRTSHWTATAVENAGFEIRDVISHIQGAGFPKSLDVGKSIYARRDDSPRVRIVCRWLRSKMDSHGVTATQIAAEFGFHSRMVEHWAARDTDSQPYLPTLEQIPQLLSALGDPGVPDEIVDLMVELNGRKGQPGEEWFRREVLGQHVGDMGGLAGERLGSCGGNITAPASDAAKQWDGWGTALKPSHENWILARKPLMGRGVNVRDVVESNLRARGALGVIEWQKEIVKDASHSSHRASLLLTNRRLAGGTSAVSAGASETGKEGPKTHSSSGTLGTGGPRAIPAGVESTAGRRTRGSEVTLSQRMGEDAHAAGRPSSASLRSIISTAEEPNTDDQLTGKSTRNSAGTDSPVDTESFVGIATGLTGSMASVRIERNTAGVFVWPNGLPITTPGKPLTVAQNVIEHGTGGLNIAACRVGTDEVTGWGGGGSSLHDGGLSRDGGDPRPVSGRWPPNTLLSHSAACVRIGTTAIKANPAWNDNRPPSSFTGSETSPVHHSDEGKETVAQYDCAADCPIAELGRQSGEAGGSPGGRNNAARKSQSKGADKTHSTMGFSGSGTAARFFPNFHPDPPNFPFFYSAKPSSAERDAGLDTFEALPGGTRRNSHPTVKSTELMRWLLRLITPPGGTVLDPFAGSGTTGIACVLEGFDFHGIELDDLHTDIARARIAHVAGGTWEPITKKARAEKPKQGDLFS